MSSTWHYCETNSSGLRGAFEQLLGIIYPPETHKIQKKILFYRKIVVVRGNTPGDILLVTVLCQSMVERAQCC